MRDMSQLWKELAADKKRRQLDAIPKQWLISLPSSTTLDVTGIPSKCGLLTTQELTITETTDVEVLLRKLSTGEWSSVQVTTAFYKRAIIAQQLVNCLTEIFVERALARAAELDAYLKATGKVVGPLHGLPISLKDQVSIKGLETTMGYASWVGQYATRDAVLVEILYEAGAVPFVRTNVCQTLMWTETYNHVFGRTLNPRNRSLTCGGSSGGEGALVGFKGSPLGVGSDIGGSIRIPAAFNGTYALRPSYGRVPYEGCVNSLEGQDSIPSVLGPLSNSLSGVKLFMQAVIASKPWLRDPLAVRKKWDDEAYTLTEHGGGKDLCFAILWSDDVITPTPPITRALEITKQALLAAGHKVIDWKPYKHAEIYNAIRTIWNAASKQDYDTTTAVSGEPIITTMEPVTEDNAEADLAFRPSSGSEASAYQLWQVHKQKRILRKEYLDHWQSTAAVTGTGRPVDAIISPVAPNPPSPHGKNKTAEYTMVWNTLDYPACVFPVTIVDLMLDAKKAPHQFLTRTDERVYKLYDPQTFWNAPVGLQLVGRTLEEEAVIAMSEIVDAALKRQVISKL